MLFQDKDFFSNAGWDDNLFADANFDMSGIASEEFRSMVGQAGGCSKVRALQVRITFSTDMYRYRSYNQGGFITYQISVMTQGGRIQ